MHCAIDGHQSVQVSTDGNEFADYLVVLRQDLIILQAASEMVNKCASEIGLEINIIKGEMPVTPLSHANRALLPSGCQ